MRTAAVLGSAGGSLGVSEAASSDTLALAGRFRLAAPAPSPEGELGGAPPGSETRFTDADGVSRAGGGGDDEVGPAGGDPDPDAAGAGGEGASDAGSFPFSPVFSLLSLKGGPAADGLAARPEVDCRAELRRSDPERGVDWSLI